MKGIKNIIALMLLLSNSLFLSAQITINEYSASNIDMIMDANGKSEDWIELYNAAGTSMSIGGMFLSDRPSKPMKWQIPSGTMVPANGVILIWCSGRDAVIAGERHTNFKLSQTTGKDSVVLSSSAGIILEQWPLNITHNAHSNARATDGGPNWVLCSTPTPGTSNNGSPQFNAYAQPAFVSLTAGFYTGSQTVAVTTAEPNSTIRYTTDGTAPLVSSTPYTTTVTITQNTVFKATVFSNDSLIRPSIPVSNTYFIDENISLAVLSIGADGVTDLANGDGAVIPIGSIEYFDINGVRQADSYGSLNRHGQDSWVLDHRSIDWVSRDEMGHSKAIFAKMFNYSDRDEFQRIIMRASGDDNYPAINDGDHDGSCHVRDEYVHVLAQNGGMKLDVRAVERVIVFLNGDYWGVYGLRERPVDHDYIKWYYGHGKYDLQFLSTWGATEAEYGGQQAFDDWAVLKDFIMNNDMGIAANYQYVDDNIRLTSMCDYFIANLNSVASDWLNYNTGWYRGLDPTGNHKKWGYVLWDNDATFDYYINYSGVPNTNPDAQPCDIDEISDYMDDFFGSPWGSTPIGFHEKIFLKLQEESPIFRQLYFSRQADLINTVYTCDNMLNTLDSMIATIDPEMDRQIARWGGTRTEWETNVATMRDFIAERCTSLAVGMTDCFEVTGPYDLTLQVQPAGWGEIQLNTIDVTQFPWTGSYFGNMDNLLKAKPNAGKVFSHWETSGGTIISPDADSVAIALVLSQAETITAVFQWPVGIEEDTNAGFEFGAYPTSVTDYLKVSYDLMSDAKVSLELFSAIGVKVADFSTVRGEKQSGKHCEQLDIRKLELASGTYLLKFQADDRSRTLKIFVN